ncbi:MAG: hypothetical protein IJ583_04410 [Firmicutes bacterium]|nr:hypothetical protein [Bacillota bacterium]
MRYAFIITLKSLESDKTKLITFKKPLPIGLRYRINGEEWEIVSIKLK